MLYPNMFIKFKEKLMDQYSYILKVKNMKTFQLQKKYTAITVNFKQVVLWYNKASFN